MCKAALIIYPGGRNRTAVPVLFACQGLSVCAGAMVLIAGGAELLEHTVRVVHHSTMSAMVDILAKSILVTFGDISMFPPPLLGLCTCLTPLER